MGTVMLNQSKNVCRLCGKEQLDPTISLFENSNDPSLKEEISFFLPIQVNIVVNGSSYSCRNITHLHAILLNYFSGTYL